MDRSGQAEPLTALAAVSVLAVALALYAGAFEAAVPESADQSLADPTADRIERLVATGGVIDADADRPLAGALDAGPEEYETNVTLRAGDERYAVGPTPTTTADVTTRRVSVSHGPGRASPGRLEVAVWT